MIVLNPMGRGVVFEDGRLSNLLLASSSRPSLGVQEKEVKRVWEMGYKHLYCCSLNRADRSCGAEGNGTVRVGKGRGRRIHVSNQRALAPKSERVEEGIEVRGHLARSALALALALGHTYTPPEPLSISCKVRLAGPGGGACIKQSSSINSTQSGGDNSQLSSTRENLLVTIWVVDRTGVQSWALFICSSIRPSCI